MMKNFMPEDDDAANASPVGKDNLYQGNASPDKIEK
jgi:hypothetical protein